MEEEDTEETEIQTPLGPMYLIYRPKGKNGRKDEIKANWVSDATMNAETAKGPDSHPVLGRFTDFPQPELHSQTSQRSFNHFTRFAMTTLPQLVRRRASSLQREPRR